MVGSPELNIPGSYGGGWKIANSLTKASIPVLMLPSAHLETVMSGPAIAYQFKLDGNTLWLTSKTTTPPLVETRLKLTREE